MKTFKNTIENLYIVLQGYGRKLENIFPCDKRMHFIIGNIISTILLPFFVKIPNIGFLLILLILGIVGYGIEFMQRLTKTGTYDLKDFLAVMIGGILPIIVVFFYVSC